MRFQITWTKASGGYNDNPQLDKLFSFQEHRPFKSEIFDKADWEEHTPGSALPSYWLEHGSNHRTNALGTIRLRDRYKSVWVIDFEDLADLMTWCEHNRAVTIVISWTPDELPKIVL